MDDWGIWHWLVVFQHELLLFAGVFFLIGALDDLAVDLAWLWLKFTGRAQPFAVNRHQMRSRELHAPAAIFIPAWQEAQVIGETIAHMLNAWPHRAMRIYVGIYRNDPATLEAAMRAAATDPRIRLVIHDRDGPSTKADCLNRLFQAMCDDEMRALTRFGYVVFHDAEDMVDPAGLSLLDTVIDQGVDFAQLPVEPLPQASRHWLGSHYCEEFAEAHGKAMVVRNALGAGLPAAGVGCAVSRKALDLLVRVAEQRGGSADPMTPFAPDSLTEDYELGLTISANGGRCEFVRARGEDDLLVATRAYFPSRLNDIVRQKTRWVHGIALQGWDRIGWSPGDNGSRLIEGWMRARDRRGPLTALVLALGYTLLVVTALIGLGGYLGMAEIAPLSPLLMGLLWVNFGFFAWRTALRFAFTMRNYGFAEGVFAVLRIPVTNVISIMAGRRAVTAYARTLLGQAAVWDKTPHNRHPTSPHFTPLPPRRAKQVQS